MDLDGFLSNATEEAAWLREPGIDCLVRLGPRLILGERHAAVLDIAHVKAARPGGGAFGRFLDKADAAPGVSGIYVEHVVHDRFARWLERNGFRVVLDDRRPSLFRRSRP